MAKARTDRSERRCVDLIHGRSEVAETGRHQEQICQSSAEHGQHLSFRAFVVGHYLPFAREHKRNWKREEFNLSHHIFPYLGEYPLVEVSAATLKGWAEALQQSGFAYSTCFRYFWLAKYILNCAVRWGFLASDRPFKDALMERGAPRRPEILTHGEALELVRLLKEHRNRCVAGAIHLLLLTGAGKSEILCARWEDLDFANRTLVSRQTPSGRPRLIPLTDEAVEVICGLPRRKDVPWLFFTRTGKHVTSLSRVWAKIRAALGRPELHLQDLRHTFASILLGAGVGQNDLHSIMGHYMPDTLAMVREAQLIKKPETAMV